MPLLGDGQPGLEVEVEVVAAGVSFEASDRVRLRWRRAKIRARHSPRSPARETRRSRCQPQGVFCAVGDGLVAEGQREGRASVPVGPLVAVPGLSGLPDWP
jgi:hypothetical protein